MMPANESTPPHIADQTAAWPTLCAASAAGLHRQTVQVVQLPTSATYGRSLRCELLAIVLRSPIAIFPANLAETGAFMQEICVGPFDLAQNFRFAFDRDVVLGPLQPFRETLIGLDQLRGRFRTNLKHPQKAGVFLLIQRAEHLSRSQNAAVVFSQDGITGIAQPDEVRNCQTEHRGRETERYQIAEQDFLTKSPQASAALEKVRIRIPAAGLK